MKQLLIMPSNNKENTKRFSLAGRTRPIQLTEFAQSFAVTEFAFLEQCFHWVCDSIPPSIKVGSSVLEFADQEGQCLEIPFKSISGDIFCNNVEKIILVNLKIIHVRMIAVQINYTGGMHKSMQRWQQYPRVVVTFCENMWLALDKREIFLNYVGAFIKSKCPYPKFMLTAEWS